MENKQTLKITLEKEDEGRYLELPFDLAGETERLDIRYSYPANRRTETGGVVSLDGGAVVDLALLAPGGAFAGASGSERRSVWVSPLGSSPGFERRRVSAGRWTIIAGAYKVPEQGVTVEYEISQTPKSRRLFKGDTHLHTTASDGSGTAEEAAALARQMGLDFIFITDHNNYAGNTGLPRPADLTVMPGCEWTHYQGHAGLLGAEKPFEGSYTVSSSGQAAAFLAEARLRGAFAVINHPFCPLVPWRWGFDLPFDALEVWNGIMSERNERAAAFWHSRLCAGERIPVTGGSDYHRPGILGSAAMPCQCLWAPSRDPDDIMTALRNGSGYVSYLPEGPGLDIVRGDNGEPCLGEEVPGGTELEFRFFGLRGGDALRFLGAGAEENVPCPPGAVEMTLRRVFTGTPFIRAELYRSYAPGLPPMKALLASPVYFTP